MLIQWQSVEWRSLLSNLQAWSRWHPPCTLVLPRKFRMPCHCFRELCLLPRCLSSFNSPFMTNLVLISLLRQSLWYGWKEIKSGWRRHYITPLRKLSSMAWIATPSHPHKDTLTTRSVWWWPPPVGWAKVNFDGVHFSHRRTLLDSHYSP